MTMSARHSLTMLAFMPFLFAKCLSFFLHPSLVHQRNICLYQNLDDWRNMLESSWNVESMGQVPNSPQRAAEEAASAIIGARNNGIGDVCVVDLLLPQYDIQQGANLYDEVEAVDFCRLLANCLQTRSVIYVRDESTLKTVSRLINARESRGLEEQAQQQDQYEFVEEVFVETNDDDFDSDSSIDYDDLHDNQSALEVPALEDDDVEFFDDFSDFASADLNTFYTLDESTVSNPPSSASSEKIPLSSAPGDSKSKNTTKKQKKILKKLVKRNFEKESDATTASLTQPSYRLASLFGDKHILSGSAMSDSVVKAVKAHGLPMTEEETMILLSSNSEEEMLAIRALVSKYAGKKKIILVNCKLDPLPPELENCHTVYHLTPLIATSAVDPRNIFSKTRQDGEQRQPIKVVLIRRYPGDWEVFVDVDATGFVLAERASAKKFAKKGPSLEWIGGVVKEFLKFREMKQKDT